MASPRVRGKRESFAAPKDDFGAAGNGLRSRPQAIFFSRQAGRCLHSKI
jgi:hypothetical protein